MRGRTWIYVSLVIAAPLIATLAVVFSWTRLSVVVDTFAPWPQWDIAEGRPGSLSGPLFIAWVSACIALVGVAMIAADRRPAGARTAAVAMPYFAWFYSLGVLRSVSLDLTGQADKWWQLLLMMILAASIASVARFITSTPSRRWAGADVAAVIRS